MLLGTINLLPGVRYRLFIGLWTNCSVFNCQVVEWVLIFANPVFKNPDIFNFIDTIWEWAKVLSHSVGNVLTTKAAKSSRLATNGTTPSMVDQEHEQVQFVKVGFRFVPVSMHHMITKRSGWGIFLGLIPSVLGVRLSSFQYGITTRLNQFWIIPTSSQASFQCPEPGARGVIGLLHSWKPDAPPFLT